MTKQSTQISETSANSWKTSEKVVIGSMVSAFWLGAGAGAAYMSGRSDIGLPLLISAAASLVSGIAVKGYKDCQEEDLFDIPSSTKASFFSLPKVNLPFLVQQSKALIRSQDRDVELDGHPEKRNTYTPPDLSV